MPLATLNFVLNIAVIVLVGALTVLFLKFREIFANIPQINPEISIPELDLGAQLENEETQQLLGGIFMGSIVALLEDQESQTFVKNFVKQTITEELQNLPIPGLPSQTAEEKAETDQTVKKITKEVAMGILDEQLPPLFGSILDSRYKGWREKLGDNPHALIQVANFLGQVDLKGNVEGWVQNKLENLAGSLAGANPASSTKTGHGGVR